MVVLCWKKLVNSHFRTKMNIQMFSFVFLLVVCRHQRPIQVKQVSEQPYQEVYHTKGFWILNLIFSRLRKHKISETSKKLCPKVFRNGRWRVGRLSIWSVQFWLLLVLKNKTCPFFSILLINFLDLIAIIFHPSR